jgi:acyl carrier protein
MGLDGVELILAFEDEFQIEISDAQAEKMVTVGDSVDIIYDILRPKKSAVNCFSQKSFYLIRRNLMEIFNVPRSEVKLNSNLEAIIPLDSRAVKWEKFIKLITSSKFFYHHLTKRSANCKFSIFSVTLIIFLLLLFLLPDNIRYLCLPGSWLMLYLACLFSKQSHKIHFPTKFKKVRDLIYLVPEFEDCIYTKDEVYRKVIPIAVDQLGIKAERVKLDAKWVDDLNVG